jgi:hypothetical protein
MSGLVPVGALARTAVARPWFDVAVPSPILGQTAFLRLPAAADWKYETSPAEMHVQHNLILRDQMWVTRGEARFVAVHTSGARFEVSVRVKPWKGSICSASYRKSGEPTSPEAPDERNVSRPLLGRLRLKGKSETRFVIRCPHTKRQVRLWWRTEGMDTRGVGGFQSLLAFSQCH